MSKLYIIMVGLPARGKSTVALRLHEGLRSEDLAVRIFNNGELRRSRLGAVSSLPLFYHPDNIEGRAQREELAAINADAAKAFLSNGGQVAIIDATNASRSRRAFLESRLNNAPILYVECVSEDPALLEATVQRKARLPEFAHLPLHAAVASFMERISYYQRLYASLEHEDNFVRVDSLRNAILKEKLDRKIPYYIRIRDILVSDWVRELFLVRHGESEYNVEDRIGGDAPLTAKGWDQAEALARHFSNRHIPSIFISTRRRSEETARPISAMHPEAVVTVLPELDEIDVGICDSMRYEDIRRQYPEEFAARALDKYNYIYPKGEGYVTLRERVERGFRKALFLAGGQPGIMIIGHQAINRMILSLFLFRRTEDVPYIYVPQNRYFSIVATHQKKLFELVPFGNEPAVSGRAGQVPVKG